MNTKITKLSKNEESILETLWEQDRPLSRSEIIKYTKDRKWKINSFYGLLNNLLDNDFVKVDGVVPTGKNFGRAYVPTLTRDEYDLKKFEVNMEAIKGRKSVFIKYLKNIIKSDYLDLDNLKELEDIISEEIRKSS